MASFPTRTAAAPERPPSGLPLEKAALPLLLLAVTAVFVALMASASFTVEGRRWFTLGDDAMISMRYAEQMARGHGLVWNVGERVQGFTNLGWTLVMALVHWLGLPLRLTSLAVQIINLALHLALTAYVFAFIRSRAGLGAAALAGALVGLNGPLLAYAVMGFETSLQTLLLTVALLRFVPAEAFGEGEGFDRPGRLWAVPLLCAAAFVVRPDAAVFLATGTAAALLAARGDRAATGRVLLALAAGVGLIAAVMLWQKSYYGDWFPNTYYLKASADTRQFGRGVKYVAKFGLQEYQLAFLLGPAALLLAGLARRASRTAYLPASLVAGVWVAYLVWVGGDVFDLSRFWTPVIPLLAVCAVLLLRRWLAAGSGGEVRVRRLAGAGLALLLALQPLEFVRRVPTFLGDNRGASVTNLRYALALSRAGLRPGDTVAVFLAGMPAYFLPGVRFHDLLGKCDRHIAHSPAQWGPPGHNKWDFAYSLGEVRPRYLITVAPYAALGTPEAVEALMRGKVARRDDFGFYPSLWLDPLFRRDYRRVTLSLDGTSIEGQELYERRAP